MKKSGVKKSNSALITILLLILALFIVAIILVYHFRESLFENKLRKIEAGENVADAYVINEETAFIYLSYDSKFNQIFEIAITFYDDKDNRYSYVSYLQSYSQEINHSQLNLEDFGSIKGVSAEYLFISPFPAPSNQTNYTIEQHSLTPLGEFIRILKSFS